MAEKPPPFCSSRHYSGMFTPDGDNNFTPCVCPARAICHLRTQSCCHSTRPPEWRPRQSAPGPPLASLACSFLILEHSYSGCNFFFNRIWKFIKNFVLGHSIQLVDLISHPGDESLPQALGGQSPKQWTARDIHRDVSWLYHLQACLWVLLVSRKSTWGVFILSDPLGFPGGLRAWSS